MDLMRENKKDRENLREQCVDFYLTFRLSILLIYLYLFRLNGQWLDQEKNIEEAKMRFCTCKTIFRCTCQERIRGPVRWLVGPLVCPSVCYDFWKPRFLAGHGEILTTTNMILPLKCVFSVNTMIFNHLTREWAKVGEGACEWRK